MDRPLTELLRARDEALVGAGPIHGRVLELVEPGEAPCWVLAAFEPPADLAALHRALRAAVERTLLSDVCRPPESLDGPAAAFERLYLVLFPEVPGAEAALRAFALGPIDPRGRALDRPLAHLRGEAQRCGVGGLGEPWAAYAAPIVVAEGALELEDAMRAAAPREPWGTSPGVPARELAAALRARHGVDITFDLEGLRRAERLIVPDAEGAIRYLPPLVFQALCDLVGVALACDTGAQPEWAVGHAGEDGLAPPPMLRVHLGGEPAYVPLGVEVLRWCVMPRMPGERIPPLADWAAGSFGA